MEGNHREMAEGWVQAHVGFSKHCNAMLESGSVVGGHRYSSVWYEVGWFSLVSAEIC